MGVLHEETAVRLREVSDHRVEASPARNLPNRRLLGHHVDDDVFRVVLVEEELVDVDQRITESHVLRPEHCLQGVRLVCLGH
jgi:hypothetical protein